MQRGPRGVYFFFGIKEEFVWWTQWLEVSWFRVCLEWRRTGTNGFFRGVWPN